MNSTKTLLQFIRNSEVNTFKTCRFQWFMSYKLEREQRGRGALVAGTLAHAVLERWYPKGRRRGAKKLKNLVRPTYRKLVESGRLDDGLMHKAVSGSGGDPIAIEDLIYHMMENYQDHYGDDEHWEVIEPERTFQVQVNDTRTGEPIAVVVGQVDLTVFDHNRGVLGFGEHKTGTGLEPFGAPIHLDEQNGTYWTYGPIALMHDGVIENQSDVAFLEYNRLDKNISVDNRPQDEEGRRLNQNGTVSKQQPAPKFKREVVWRTDEERSLFDRRFQKVAKEILKARRKKIAIYKSPGKHCGYCEFREACEVHEVGGDWKAVLAATTTHWDPYEDHRGKEIAVKL